MNLGDMVLSTPTPHTIRDIRYANFRALLTRFEEKCSREGTPVYALLKQFGEFTGVSARYLSHLNNRRKAVGDLSAATLEKAFGLPLGWMDVDHSREAANLGEQQFLAQAQQLYRENPTEAQALMIRYLSDRLFKDKPNPE